MASAPLMEADKTVGFTVLFLELFGEPIRRGFFCNDDTIKYPFTANTIGESAIVLAAVLLPFLVILPTQLWLHGPCIGRTRLWRWTIPEWVSSGGYKYGFYLVGLGLMQIVSCIGKFTLGRLRPHFLAVCRPNVACNGTDFGYITQYTCAGDLNSVREARLSFPSGHSSAAFFASIYLTIFLESSPKWRNYGCLRRSMQFLLLSTAWWVSLSRVMDNWHHWSDVLAGVILGSTIAIMTVKYLPGVKTRETFSNHPDEPFLSLNKTSSNNRISEIS